MSTNETTIPVIIMAANMGRVRRRRPELPAVAAIAALTDVFASAASVIPRAATVLLMLPSARLDRESVIASTSVSPATALER